MANEADLKLIQIPEFETTDTLAGTGDEYVVVTKADGKTYNMRTEDFKSFLGTVQVQVPKALAPTDPAPTLSGVYYPTTDGTYANAGGLTVNTAEGQDDFGKQVQFVYDGSTWVKIAIPLPVQDISGLATEAEVFGTEVLFAATLPNAFDNNGNPVTTTSTNQTPPIFMKPGDRLDFYVRTSGMAAFFYDESDAPISGVSTGSATAINFQSSAIAPAGTAYAKVKTLNVAQGGYQPAHFYARVYGLSGKIGKIANQKTGQQYQGGDQVFYKGNVYEALAVTSTDPSPDSPFWKKKIEVPELSETKFDLTIADTTLGTFGADGIFVESTQANITGFIPVERGWVIEANIQANRFLVWFYDENYNPLVGAVNVGVTVVVQTVRVVVPNGAKYVRVRDLNATYSGYVPHVFYMRVRKVVTMDDIANVSSGGWSIEGNVTKTDKVVEIYSEAYPDVAPLVIKSYGKDPDYDYTDFGENSLQTPNEIYRLAWGMQTQFNLVKLNFPSVVSEKWNIEQNGLISEHGMEGFSWHVCPPGFLWADKQLWMILKLGGHRPRSGSKHGVGNASLMQVFAPIYQERYDQAMNRSHHGWNAGAADSVPGQMYRRMSAHFNYPEFVRESFSNLQKAFWVNYRRSRGSSQNPTALIYGDSIYKYVFSAYDGDEFRDVAEFEIISVDDTTAATRGGAFVFRTVKKGTSVMEERFRINENGCLQVTGLNTAPASATAPGVQGEIRYTADYMYVCTAANTWKRTALETW